jgi:peptidyl-prolyl cis-trans isomerase C
MRYNKSLLRVSLAAGVALSMVSYAANANADTELAKVNQKTISRQDLLDALGSMNQPQRENVLKDMSARRQLFQQLVDQEVLAQEGEKLKLDETAEFKKAMATFRRQLLVSQVTAKKLAGQGTPSEAKAYYESHKQDFSGDRVNVQHILLKDEKEAKDIAQKAKDSSNDFQVLAEKYSVDPNAKNNRGNAGWILKGTMAPEFTEAAFAAKEGSIVGPVKTSFGYHIIKVLAKQVGKPLDYNEIELQVQGVLRAKLTRKLIDDLRAHAQIKVDTNALDKM